MDGWLRDDWEAPEEHLDNVNIYYAMWGDSPSGDGVLSTPIRINDYPGLSTQRDGGVLDAVLISDTLHVTWPGAHYTNRWADYSHRNDANIYYDAMPLTPQPTVQKVYALSGNAAAMRVGPKGQAGDLYYLHGDHTGSLSLVTDAAGNEVGRVWYDP